MALSSDRLVYSVANGTQVGVASLLVEQVGSGKGWLVRSLQLNDRYHAATLWVTANRTLFTVLVNVMHNGSIVQQRPLRVDVRSFTVIGAELVIPEVALPLDLDPTTGQTLLVLTQVKTPPYLALQTWSAVTGALLHTWTGGQTGMPFGAALHPTTGANLAVFDGDDTAVMCSISRQNDTACQWETSVDIGALFLSLLVDAVQDVAYMATIQVSDLVGCHAFDRVPLRQQAPSTRLASFCGLNALLPSYSLLNVDRSTSTIYTIDLHRPARLLVLDSRGNFTSTSLSINEQRELPWPSSVALSSDGARLWVGQNGLVGVVKLDGEGQQVNEYRLPTLACARTPFQSPAVKQRSELLLPVCNGSLVQLDARLRPVRWYALRSGMLPRSVAVSSDDSAVYFSDNNSLSQVYRLDRASEPSTLRCTAAST